MSEAFKTQLVSLLPRLRRHALARTGTVHAADDLLQATCERAWKCRDQLQPGTRLDGWMFTIMGNLHIDEIRAVARRGIAADPDLLDRLADDAWQRRIEGSLALRKVLAAMQELPMAMREILALVTVDGLSYREAADTLGIPLGTVMSRLARARMELLRRMEARELTREGAAK